MATASQAFARVLRAQPLSSAALRLGSSALRPQSVSPSAPKPFTAYNSHGSTAQPLSSAAPQPVRSPAPNALQTAIASLCSPQSLRPSPLSSQPTRGVASVHKGKLRGNLVEAWETREVEAIKEKRDPKFFPDFNVGDSIVVRLVNPYNPKRLMTFAGVVIAKYGGKMSASFRMRNALDGFPVEQQFPLYSPHLKGIQVLKKPAKKPRRAKLFYLRTRAPREYTVAFSEADVKLPKQ